MDTTVIAYTAEDLISHKLQRNGILVAKPKFDRDGTDLIALLNVNDGARFCRIQCKGRSLRNSGESSIEVFADYVSNAFVLFLFVETFDSENTHLFAFFGSEIEKKWSRGISNSREVFRLAINASKLQDEWDPYRFTDGRVNNIKRLIERANVTGEFKHVFTGEAHVTISAVTCAGTGTVT